MIRTVYLTIDIKMRIFPTTTVLSSLKPPHYNYTPAGSWKPLSSPTSKQKAFEFETAGVHHMYMYQVAVSDRKQSESTATLTVRINIQFIS
jgi:hypothetical protein